LALQIYTDYTFTMPIPLFPDFAPLSLAQRSEIHQKLSSVSTGLSEFSFSGLFLFSERYNYRVSKLEDDALIISGLQPCLNPGAERKQFFFSPCAIPPGGILKELFKTHDYWKNISESQLTTGKESLEEMGIEVLEDRDNFDYLYLRTELAELKGKKFHKKRNLVAQFQKLYTHEEKPLTQETKPDVLEILKIWREKKGEDGDYAACLEALAWLEELDLKGFLLYIDGKPAGFCMGEIIAQGRIFAVHFEKGLDTYRGIYQFINRAFASSLPESITQINREQDLGDEGLRRAKLSYRPAGFVKKYTGYYHPAKGGIQ
jgi:hypothetical protein